MVPRVLIAEADADLRAIYQRFFSYHRWQVQTAGGGLECLAKLRQLPPDLLVLDWELPWGGGEGVLALMRENPRLLAVPVLLTSVLTSPKALADLLSPPVVQALRKPFPLGALLEHQSVRHQFA
jgi:DNA-binding response OmpR family regulator